MICDRRFWGCGLRLRIRSLVCGRLEVDRGSFWRKSVQAAMWCCLKARIIVSIEGLQSLTNPDVLLFVPLKVPT